MIITEIGRYRLLEDWSTRATNSIGQMKKGAILDITQVDKTYRQVLGPELMDWAPWDMPVEKVD